MVLDYLQRNGLLLLKQLVDSLSGGNYFYILAFFFSSELSCEDLLLLFGSCESKTDNKTN